MIEVHIGVSCNVHLGLPCRKNYEESKLSGCVSMIYVHVHVDRCIYTLVNVYITGKCIRRCAGIHGRRDGRRIPSYSISSGNLKMTTKSICLEPP